MAPAPIDAAAAAALLRTLANPARLRILLALLAGERSVAALEGGLDLRQPMLSQHLGALREAGLVAARRESRAVFYGLAGEASRRLVTGLVQGFGGSVAPPAPPAALPGRRPDQAAVFATVGEA